MIGREQIAENHASTALATPFKLPQALKAPENYFRSKLFIAPLTTNPLVTAAGPLLSLLERLNTSTSLPPVQTIRDNIEHELQAFHCKLNSQTHPAEMIAIAKYLLSATLDELIGKNYLRLNDQLAEFKAFTPPSSDGVGPEKYFFDIVSFLNDRPTQYLDLLELAYFCLLAGFEGQNHQKADGRQTLDNLIEALYLNIQQHRVNKPTRLFKEQPKENIQQKNHKPLLAVSLCAIAFITTALIVSHFWLEKQASEVMFGQYTLAKLD
jgi:type IV/VI secretion system ImpK/VasF family protein